MSRSSRPGAGAELHRRRCLPRATGGWTSSARRSPPPARRELRTRSAAVEQRLHADDLPVADHHAVGRRRHLHAGAAARGERLRRDVLPPGQRPGRASRRARRRRGRPPTSGSRRPARPTAPTTWRAPPARRRRLRKETATCRSPAPRRRRTGRCRSAPRKKPSAGNNWIKTVCQDNNTTTYVGPSDTCKPELRDRRQPVDADDLRDPGRRDRRRGLRRKPPTAGNNQTDDGLPHRRHRADVHRRVHRRAGNRCEPVEGDDLQRGGEGPDAGDELQPRDGAVRKLLRDDRMRRRRQRVDGCSRAPR